MELWKHGKPNYVPSLFFEKWGQELTKHLITYKVKAISILQDDDIMETSA